MKLAGLDYIGSVNSLCEELFRSHRDVLLRKNILRKRDLIQAIKLDLDKLTHALFEVRENSATAVLETFFDSGVPGLPEFSKRLTDDAIYHVGFEIHEPLDLVLHGINHWIEHSQQSLGEEMSVRDYLRFPASEAFQKRVGAYTEILRIWLQVNERELMLELFDIQRPAEAMIAGAPKPAHRDFSGLFLEDDRVHGHEERILGLFAADEIWHYALSVKNPEDVVHLHGDCESLAAQDPCYRVPYSHPVDNRHDGSFHTKVIREAQPDRKRMELEFVTHYPD